MFNVRYKLLCCVVHYRHGWVSCWQCVWGGSLHQHHRQFHLYLSTRLPAWPQWSVRGWVLNIKHLMTENILHIFIMTPCLQVRCSTNWANQADCSALGLFLFITVNSLCYIKYKNSGHCIICPQCWKSTLSTCFFLLCKESSTHLLKGQFDSAER